MKRFQSFGLTAMFALSVLFAQFGHVPTASAAPSDCGLCGNYQEPEEKASDTGLCGDFDGGVKDEFSAEKGGRLEGLCGNFDG